MGNKESRSCTTDVAAVCLVLSSGWQDIHSEEDGEEEEEEDGSHSSEEDNSSTSSKEHLDEADRQVSTCRTAAVCSSSCT